MNYEETLDHIFSRGRFGIKPGLERIRRLLNGLGRPHERLRIVQIAGTNGKGSTASFLAAILQAAGIRTGLYTSPHLTSFTERIRIDGEEIGRHEVALLAERVIAAAAPETTFFELVTAMAFLHFAERRVELAIMETGMGGRWDATNIASGILSIITPVSLDHCEYLGASLAGIAAEKAGIIKPGCPVVVAAQPDEVQEVIDRRCRETNSTAFVFGKDFVASWGPCGLDYRGMSWSVDGITPGIGGRYQSGNAACALAAAELLAKEEIALELPHLMKGIEVARWPGRMELFDTVPRILLDGAHNPAGSAALADALDDIPRRRLLLIVGIMADKDVEEVLGPLLPISQQVYAVTPSIDRAMPSAALQQQCCAMGVPATDAGTVAAGLAQARESASADDLIVVCGSLFTVGEARSILLDQEFRAIRG